MTVRTGVSQTGHSFSSACISQLATQGTYHWDENILTAFRSRFEPLALRPTRKKTGKNLRGRYYQSGVSSSLCRRSEKFAKTSRMTSKFQNLCIEPMERLPVSKFSGGSRWVWGPKPLGEWLLQLLPTRTVCKALGDLKRNIPCAQLLTEGGYCLLRVLKNLKKIQHAYQLQRLHCKLGRAEELQRSAAVFGRGEMTHQ